MNGMGEILLVDDTPENLQVLGDLLRRHGFTVRVAPSGILALRSVAARRPDLILLDIRMPDMDGFETCRRLRADPGLLGTPILFLSASDAADDRVEAFQAGGQDFISKPFQTSEVMARVSTHLQLARTRRDLDRINEQLARQVSVEGRLRQVAEADAEDRQLRLDLTLNAAKLGIWEVDQIDGSVAFDARARLLLGLPAGLRPKWRDFLRLIPEAAEEGITRRWERSKREKGSFDVEGWWTLPGDGGRRRIRLRGRHLDAGEGRSGELVGVIWDVTDEHLLRERLAQRERLESLGLLAGGVAHDFNNHLAVIVGELDILGMQDLPARAQPHLAGIGQAADASAALIRDLLSFARRRETVRAPLDLAALLRRAAHLAARSLGTAIQTTVAIAEGDWWVSGDAGQLENAVLNLCINARDAMPGGGSLGISLAREEAGGVVCQVCQQAVTGSWLVIRIADSGSGIPDEIRPRIFEPFFTTKPEEQGNGLGLPSVVGCVAAHAGHLSLDSVPGKGSCFAIHLPAVEAQAPGRPRARPGGGRTGSLLVLDDQQTVREVISDGLRRLGWTVTDFAEPAEAIAAWGSPGASFAVALIDMAMPGMNGATVFRALRAKDPSARVVLMSGHTGGDSVDALLAEGLAGFIEKPVKLRPLSDLLSGLIPEPKS